MKTERLYYNDSFIKEFSAQVKACEPDGKNYKLILDKTAFYPEGGGQPSDTGYVFLYNEETGAVSDTHVSVLNVYEDGDEIVHTVTDAFACGDRVKGVLDWERRFDHMQQHSGEHIVSGMLCSTYKCDNTGFHMGKDTVTIDYNADIPWEGILEIEKRANRYIWENHTFVQIWPSGEELSKLNYRFKKELSGDIRITSFPGADMCACCGTHVNMSGQVGMVKFISCQKFRDGVRIELLCGNRAYEYLKMNLEQNQAIACDMSTKTDNTYKTFCKQKEELLAVKSSYGRLEDTYFKLLASKYENAGNVIYITDNMEGDSLRRLAMSIGEVCGGRCCALAGDDFEGGNYKYVIVSHGEDIRDFVKEMNAALSGRGGGKDGFAQGSLKALKEDISEYLNKKLS